MVRAKFRCTSHTVEGDGAAIVLQPVTGGSKENDSFYRYTPAGEIRLTTINQDAAKQFEVNKEYYVDFSAVDTVERATDKD